MEVSPHYRGRGHKIHPTSRKPHSRNKQWVAGQPASTTHSPVVERWERGGSPGRGRGRGKGHVRPSQFLATPTSLGETASGTDEETGNDMDDIDADVTTDIELEDAGETPEEREKFWKELVQSRDNERKKAITEGKMDDPLVPKRLDQAITMAGTCMDMCPRFERYRRERENNLDRWEVIPGTKRVDHKRAVKIYERAAGDKTIPSDLRPPPVLRKTLNYLFHDLIQQGGFSQTQPFIRDRSRAVRSDFTMQHESGPTAIECHDRCARFHILTLHLERETPGFSVALEEQQLMNTLQSLKEFYDTQRGQYTSPTELEMRVYHRLIHIRDQKERHENIPEDITNNPVFKLTTNFRLHVQAKSAPITKTSRLIVDAEGMQIFAELAEHLREQNNVVMVYLVACIMERLFGKDTIEDIEAIRGDLSIPEIIDGVSRPLLDQPGEDNLANFEENVSEQDIDIDAHIPISASHNIAQRPVDDHVHTPGISAFGQLAAKPRLENPTSSLVGASPLDTQSSFIPPAPIQSSFGNITATPSPFGQSTSVFGGLTFGAWSPPSSNGISAPKHAFESSTPSTLRNLALNGSQNQLSPTTAPSHKPSTFPGISSSAQPAIQSISPHQITRQSIGFSTGAVSKSSASTPHSSYIHPPPISLTGPFNTTIQTTSVSSSSPFFSSSSSSDIQVLHPQAPVFAPLAKTAAPDTPLSVTPLIPSSLLSSVNPSQSPSEPAVQNLITRSTSTPSSHSSHSTASGRQLIDRRQTLFDIPSAPRTPELPPLSTTNLASPKTESHTPVITSEPPQLRRVQPISLPSTPTARSFESNSGLQQANSLFPRYPTSSSNFANLLGPSTPIHEDALSPLVLSAPGDGIFTNPNQSQPSTAEPNDMLEPQSGKSDIVRDVDNSTSSNGIAEGLPSATPASAPNLSWHGFILQKYFRIWKSVWKQCVLNREVYSEALQRSKVYKEKIYYGRLTHTMNDSPQWPSQQHAKRQAPDSINTGSAYKRSRRCIPHDYRAPLTDDELVTRLKVNHEEHQRRWSAGSFLEAIRKRVEKLSPNGEVPSGWSIWLSMNMENDGTAIWMEQKFNVPQSGKWVSSTVFSIPLLPTDAHNPKHGSTGLIIFERTPLEGLDDEIERKYRILDDCTRLRDIVSDMPLRKKRKFNPVLLIIDWTDATSPEATPDFVEMVHDLLNAGELADVLNFTIPSSTNDLDKKFEELFDNADLDVQDKSVVWFTWEELTHEFLEPVRARASDWLDSCWSSGNCDYSRYGTVVWSIEQIHSAIARELMTLLSGGSDIILPSLPVDLATPAEGGPEFASGPFIDSCLESLVATVKEAVAETLKARFMLPKAELKASQRRLEAILESISGRIWEYDATTLSSRSTRKRHPGSDEESGLESSPKRFKKSISPVDSELHVNVESDRHTDYIQSPPPSTYVSTAGLSEAPKPRVTAAMLRSLAQSVLGST